MKNKLILILLSIFLIGNYTAFSQETTINNDTTKNEVAEVEETAETEVEETAGTEGEEAAGTEGEESASFHQIIKQKFIEGGPGFMGIVLLCLILGLALAIERIIYLNMATTDTDKLLAQVETPMKSKRLKPAKKKSKN